MTDLALLLWRHGYRAVGLDRACRGGAATYRTRLLGRPAVVLGPGAGAEAFYDESLVARSGAMPRAIKNLLFGRGAVHGLDGSEHRARKKLLLGQLADDRLDGLVSDIANRLDDAVAGWRHREVRLFDELVAVYGAAALDWAGCRPFPDEARRISRGLARIVDGFGGSGLAYPRGWAARLRTDRWLRCRIERARSDVGSAPTGSALGAIAAQTELPAAVAAVELGNLVRPTVAVAWPATFAVAHLVGKDPWRKRLRTAPLADEHVAFADEVRRTTPLVPALLGRALRDAVADGVRVRAGDRLVLDVWGIDNNPSDFRPERFLDHRPGAFEMVPQGGGDVTGHRCPGESLTVRILAATTSLLARRPLHVLGTTTADLSRMPTLPDDGLRVTVVEESPVG